MTLLAFIAQMTSALMDLAKLLYVRHNGNVAAAKAELKKIPDQWAAMPARRSAIDKELEELETRGL